MITLIHRQESVSLLGIPLRRFIDVEDSEQVLRAIRLTPDTVPIDLVVHTPGGLVLASEQIARALHRHPAKVTVIVPHYAMSGGTLLALAADEILMDENAVLGPGRPSDRPVARRSIIKVAESKPLERVNDETLILADLSRKAMTQVKEFVLGMLLDDFPAERANELAEQLSSGQWTHDYPLTIEQLTQMGLPVRPTSRCEVFELMDLYPQVGKQRPSVQYVPDPVPRRSPAATAGSGAPLARRTRSARRRASRSRRSRGTTRAFARSCSRTSARWSLVEPLDDASRRPAENSRRNSQYVVEVVEAPLDRDLLDARRAEAGIRHQRAIRSSVAHREDARARRAPAVGGGRARPARRRPAPPTGCGAPRPRPRSRARPPSRSTRRVSAQRRRGIGHQHVAEPAQDAVDGVVVESPSAPRPSRGTRRSRGPSSWPGAAPPPPSRTRSRC